MSNLLAGFATREQAKRAATIFFAKTNNAPGKEGRDFHLHQNERGDWHFRDGAPPAQLRPATREEVMPSEDSNTTNARPDTGPGRECEPSGATAPEDVRELVERLTRLADQDRRSSHQEADQYRRNAAQVFAFCNQERDLRLAAEAERDRLKEALAKVEKRWSTRQDIRLRAGEMTAQEMRTTKACLDAVFRELRAALPAAQPDLDKESDR